jgi:hypothetical protein
MIITIELSISKNCCRIVCLNRHHFLLKTSLSLNRHYFILETSLPLLYFDSHVNQGDIGVVETTPLLFLVRTGFSLGHVRHILTDVFILQT